MLRSVMGHLGMIQYPVSHNLRPFNSLSRDHRLFLSVGREGTERAFNSLSRDHQRAELRRMNLLALILSTPSLGITLTIARNDEPLVERFQLPLSGSLIRQDLAMLESVKLSFQLPLSGSRSG